MDDTAIELAFIISKKEPTYLSMASGSEKAINATLFKSVILPLNFSTIESIRACSISTANNLSGCDPLLI